MKNWTGAEFKLGPEVMYQTNCKDRGYRKIANGSYNIHEDGM